MWQLSVSQWSRSIMLTQLVRGRGLTPHWGTEFFGLLMVTYSIHCYIWWPVWSPSLKHMRTCILLGGVNVSLWSSGMMLAQLARGQGSTPCWGTEFFRIANGHLFNPLLHKGNRLLIMDDSQIAGILNKILNKIWQRLFTFIRTGGKWKSVIFKCCIHR